MKNLSLSHGRVANAIYAQFLQNLTEVLEFVSLQFWGKKNLQLIKSTEVVMEAEQFPQGERLLSTRWIMKTFLNLNLKWKKMNSGPDQDSVMGKSGRAHGMCSRKWVGFNVVQSWNEWIQRELEGIPGKRWTVP